MKSHVKWLPPAILLAAAVVAGCSSDSSNSSAGLSTNQVTAEASLAFSPQSISIKTGDSVSWIFQSVGHNVTFDAVSGAPASIGGANSNVTINRTFPTAGTFTYHCTIHPSMTGSVTVGTSVVDPPPSAPPPPASNPYGYLKHS